MEEFKPLCLAPWVHAYVHTSGARELCCIAEESAEPRVMTREEFWNSPYMKEARQKMLRGEAPSECKHCVAQVKPLYEHFNWNYRDQLQSIKENTDPDGTFRGEPLSFDYRLTNLCNFKCQMCGSDNSSAWQKEISETKGEAALPNWLHKSNEGKLKEFQNASVRDLLRAIENKSLREIYWTGGEPLLNEQHWQVMQKMVAQGMSASVHVRYNTNLSILQFKGTHLFRDLLAHFPRFDLNASLDATGAIGEYLRYGLKWEQWKRNFDEALSYPGVRERMAIDHRVTAMGLSDLPNLLRVGKSGEVRILSNQVMQSSLKEVIRPLSPLAFPKDLRDRMILEAIEKCEPLKSEQNLMVFQVLEQLLRTPTYQEQFPDTYEKALRKGLKKMQDADAYRIAKQGGISVFDCFDSYQLNWLKNFQGAT